MDNDILCPECNVECQYINDGIVGCPKCGTRWVECPDCGEIVDIDEEWSVDKEVCNNCADDSSVNMLILNLENMGETIARLKGIFGKDERP